jgi:hypothetical protein
MNKVEMTAMATGFLAENIETGQVVAKGKAGEEYLTLDTIGNWIDNNSETGSNIRMIEYDGLARKVSQVLYEYARVGWVYKNFWKAEQ